MYQTIWELPTDVLNSMNEEDAKVWMDTYNNCAPETEDATKDAKKKAWHKCATLPSCFAFEIIASTDTIDKTKEIIDLDSVKEHMDEYIDTGGAIQNDHKNYRVGHIYDWEPCKVDTNKEGIVDAILVYGVLFGGKLVYDDIRKDFANGMNSLSIAGEAKKGHYECDERGCYTRRKVDQLLEISVCRNPMNKYCKMQWYNEKAGFTKSVTAQIPNRDCPICSLRDSMCAAGFDAHAKADGVHVSMSPYQYALSKGYCDRNDLIAHYTNRREAVFNRRSPYLEKVYKMCLSKGLCDEKGSFTKSMPEQIFKMFCMQDLVKCQNGKYMFKNR